MTKDIDYGSVAPDRRSSEPLHIQLSQALIREIRALPEKPGAKKKTRFGVRISAERYAVLSINGREISALSLPDGGKLAQIYINTECGMSLDDLKWAQRTITSSLQDGTTSAMLFQFS